MKFQKNKLSKENFIYSLSLIYLFPFFILILANTIFSMLQTTYMDLYLDTEKPQYKPDSPIFLIVCTLLFILILAYFFRKTSITPNICTMFKQIALNWGIFICLFNIFIFRVRVACDSSHLSKIAIAFLNNEFSSLMGDGYLVHYPHQLGMIGLLQLVYYIFGIENYTVLQFLNVIAIFFAIYYLQRITDEIFHDPQIQVLFSILCIGMFPLFLYSTFIYGDIPGLGLAIPAIYYTIRYLNTCQKRYAIPSILCMTFSIILKSNNYVILVAIILILLLHMIQNKDKFVILFIILLLIMPKLTNAAINAYYANLAQIDTIPSGIPKIAWIAMGLQKNDYIENGWYNSYNWNIYSQNSYDIDATTKACFESIKESLNDFINAPKSGLNFFYKKFISQWNDPGYQSQITIEWYSRHRDDHSKLALYLIYGNGRFFIENIMNVYHFIILLGSTILAFYNLRERKLSHTLLSLCVFGGYFFHLIWEAGGRYGLEYFILCVPMAAGGLWKLVKYVKDFSFHHHTS